MAKHSGWIVCRNSALLVELCEVWNKDRLYEILWEYGCLSRAILRERKARGWLYYEKDHLAGFALGRRLRGWWYLEELWGPCEGSTGINEPCRADDLQRARLFADLVKCLPQPLLVRAAVDNPFANIMAWKTGMDWCGGFLLSKRDVSTVGPVHIPTGCKVRKYQSRDEKHLAGIHARTFDYTLSAADYRNWATGPNSQTSIATMTGRAVGFIIAEKRPYKELGDFKIAIDPSYQGRGIGAALLETGLIGLHEVGVKTVIADFLLLNSRAQALYRRCGFQIVRAYNSYRSNRSRHRENREFPVFNG